LKKRRRKDLERGQESVGDTGSPMLKNVLKEIE
jgi:hypothetical protein